MVMQERPVVASTEGSGSSGRAFSLRVPHMVAIV